MRTLSLFALLALAAPAWAQAPTVRLGADMVAGYLSDDLSLGMAGVVLARTPGAVAGYVALRPEATVATIGGTGYYDDLDVYAYGLDGQPLYNGSTCRSVIDDEPSPGSCGANVLSVALDAEVGSRLAVGGGAVLLGAGLRLGAGYGVYGAVTGQLASPVYGRLEAGTGHMMIGLGLGRF